MPGPSAPLTLTTSWAALTPTRCGTLEPAEPDPVEDVQCQPKVARLALAWMVPKGDVDTCPVVAEQLAAGGDAHLIFQANTSGDALLLSRLEPATSYRLSLSMRGRNGLWGREVTVVCATAAEGRRPLGLRPRPSVFLPHRPQPRPRP